MNHQALSRSIEGSSWKAPLLEMMEPATAQALEESSAAELQDLFGRVVQVPVAFPQEAGGTTGREIFRLYYTAAWVSVMERLGITRDATVLEVASGDTVYVPEALDVYAGGRADYVTANLNEGLTREFYEQTRTLSTPTRVIPDDAVNLRRHLPDDSVNLAAFQHAVNDIFQTIVADQNGIDTVENDWFEILPAMARLVMAYARDGRLERELRPAFMELIANVTSLVVPGGYMVFNNCIFQIDLTSGYELDVYSSLIGIAREWIARSDLPLEVVDPDWIDPQWWMIVRKR